MKIIISPTKTMKKKSFDFKGQKAPFHNEAENIRTYLSSYDKATLKKLYKSSDKIIDNTYAYYHDNVLKDTALNMYDGLVFKQLDIINYSNENLQYIDDHLAILSTMYGVLKYNSIIEAYRLDYLMKFEEDMYEYWKSMLETYFSDESIIINLASNEYVDSVVHNNIVNIHFLNHENKSQATASKMARGNMLDYMIKHNIKDVKGLKDYKQLDYEFEESMSDSNNLYFKKVVA